MSTKLRKAFNEYGKPLSLAIAYQLLSDTTGSRLLALAISIGIAGSYLLVLNLFSKHKNEAEKGKFSEGGIHSNGGVDTVNHSNKEVYIHGYSSLPPTSKRARLRKNLSKKFQRIRSRSNSFLSLLDVLSTPKRRESKRKFNFFPKGLGPDPWRLSTAPVEEEDDAKLDIVHDASATHECHDHDLPLMDTQHSSYIPAYSSYNRHHEHERSMSNVDDSDDQDDESDEQESDVSNHSDTSIIGESSDNESDEQPLNCASTIGASESVGLSIDSVSSSDGSNSSPAPSVPKQINNKKKTQLSKQKQLQGSSKSQEEQQKYLQPTIEKKDQKPPKRRNHVTINTNPSAAYGVAAERLRSQMDSEEVEGNIENNRSAAGQEVICRSKEARQRFLRSLYAHAGIPSTKHSRDRATRHYHHNGSNSSSELSPNETFPLSPPLILATTYNIRSSGAWSDDDYFYSRISNPTRDALEKTLALAEQGYDETFDIDEDTENDEGISDCKAACFGSGMAAVSAVLGSAASLMGSLEKKVHVVVPKTCYDEAIKQIQMGSGGISSFIRVDMTNPDSVNNALSKHPDRGKILYLETPDNPYTQVCDLEALVKIARSHGAITVVDTTWSPPLVGQVFRYNVDVLCFSCTKTMGGHSDVLCGAVVANGATPLGKKIFPRVRDWQISHGAVASPFDCWLVLRGLRTLPVRLERMCSNSMKLATFMEKHRSIEWVRYPGLESHPQHKLAKGQMDMFGQIITFCIKGGSDAAMAFVGAVSLARRATSTGGTETLVQHQRSIEMVKVTPGGVIRVSVGLEDADDLVDDFRKALLCMEQVCKTLRGSSESSSIRDNLANKSEASREPKSSKELQSSDEDEDCDIDDEMYDTENYDCDESCE